MLLNNGSWMENQLEEEHKLSANCEMLRWRAKQFKEFS